MSKQTSFKKRISLFLALVMIFCLLPLSATAAPIGENEGKKDLTIYYPNWAVYDNPNFERDPHQQQTVKDLPWDKVTTINHAFWEIVPDEAHANPDERPWWPADPDRGDVPFGIRTTDAWCDIDMPGNHFDAYAEMCAKYPDVAVLISVGGWTRSGLFSTMAASAEHRATFIQSCIDTMNKYPWLAGIDLDWEYPGVEREGGGDNGRGNEVNPNDGANYTLLLQEMRATFDQAFPDNYKQITVCATMNMHNNDPKIPDPKGEEETAPAGTPVNQELANIAAVVDRINMMTYDITGASDDVTGHQSNLNPTETSLFNIVESVEYFLAEGVPAEKLNIGSPLYSRGWKIDIEKLPGGAEAFNALKQGDDLSGLLGVAASGKNVYGIWTDDAEDGGGMNPWFKLAQWEASEGFITWDDTEAGAAVMINNNPDSKYYGYFLTFDSELALQAKLDYIMTKGLGGLIVWESSGDHVASGYPMITQMAVGLDILADTTTIPVYTPTEDELDAGLPEPEPEPEMVWPPYIRTWYAGMSTIKAGDVVLHDGILYYCHTETEAWSNDWVPSGWNYDYSYQKLGALYYWEDVVEIEGSRECITLPKGDSVVFEGTLYQCVVDEPVYTLSGWTPTGWAGMYYQNNGPFVLVPEGEEPPAPAPTGFTVSFSAGTGTGTFADVAVADGETYTVTADAVAAFTLANYKFAYFVDADGNRYAKDSVITVTKDMALTAKYLRLKAPGKFAAKQEGSTIRVTYNKLGHVDGYQLAVSTKSSFSSATTGTANKKKYVKNVIKTCKGAALKAGTTYYVRVRAFTETNGVKTYGDWSPTKTVKFK